MESHSSFASSDINGSSIALPIAVSSTSLSNPAFASPGTLMVTVSLDADGIPIIRVGATTFTKFSSLSAELRIKIFKLTHPERKEITLEHLCYMSGSGDEEKKGEYMIIITSMTLLLICVARSLTRNIAAWKQEKFDPLPVALHVNHESRTEVLRAYLVIHHAVAAAAVIPTIGQPICVHRCDLYSVQFATLLYNAGEFHDRLSALKTSQPTLFNRITKLEVRNTLTQFFLLKLFIDNRRSSLAATGDPRKIYCGSFLLFPALKKITFTGKATDGNWGNLIVKKSLDNLQDWVIRFLESAKLYFNDGVAPKVIFRPFKTIEELLDE